MYLLDTDWMIQALTNRQPAAQVLPLLAGSRIWVSYVSVGELCERAFGSVNPDAHIFDFQHFLNSYHMLTLTFPIIERFAELRFFLRRRGQLTPDLDLLIAATALQHGLTLLTSNLRHFQRIPDLRLYQSR